MCISPTLMVGRPSTVKPGSAVRCRGYCDGTVVQLAGRATSTTGTPWPRSQERRHAGDFNRRHPLARGTNGQPLLIDGQLADISEHRGSAALLQTRWSANGVVLRGVSHGGQGQRRRPPMMAVRPSGQSWRTSRCAQHGVGHTPGSGMRLRQQKPSTGSPPAFVCPRARRGPGYERPARRSAEQADRFVGGQLIVRSRSNRAAMYP